MASMSHCVIENTYGDMCACVNKFDNAFNDIKNNPYELAHIAGLYNAAKQYISLYEEYLDDPDTFLVEHSPEEWAFEVTLQNGEVLYDSNSDMLTYDERCDAQSAAYEWIQDYIDDQDGDPDDEATTFSAGDFRTRIYNINQQ